MSTLTIDKFVEVVKRSGLVEDDRLDAVVESLAGQESGPDADQALRLSDRLIADGLLTKWQTDQLLKGKHKGFFLGKYKLLGHLGTGGMSSVYLAEHLLMQRRVAIKVLPQSRVDDTSYLARFRREAQAAAALDHRNIVRAYDIDNEGKHHYIVMEFVEGRDLQNLVKAEGPLDYNRAADYIRQAAEGLQHAHDANLIHRDIKPANLLVDPRGTVKVLDMGLARFTDEKTASLTIAHDENVLGTADYLAPEQAKNSHAVDYRADLYSLGCTLYYLLTGHPPFRDGSLAQRILKHQNEPPPSIYSDRKDAPKELVDVCSRMMAKQPAARFQTAGEIAATLTAWLQARGQKVETSSIVTSGSKSGAAAPPRRAAPGAPPVRPPRRGPVNPNDTLADHERETLKGVPPVVAPKPPSGSGVAQNPDFLRGDSALDQSGGFPVVSGSGKGPGSNTGAGSSKKMPPVLATARPIGQSGSGIQINTAANAGQSGAFPIAELGIPISGKVTLNTAAKVQKAKAQIPWWFWYAIGGSVLLIIVLIVLVLVTRK